MSGTGFLDRFLGKRKDEDALEQHNQDQAVTGETVAAQAIDETLVDKTIVDKEGPRDRDLEMKIMDKLREIYDPEIPVNIYDLGLVYDIFADEKGNVEVEMTLTTPHCPVAESMPGEVEMKVRDVEDVNDVKVDLVWDPPWDMTMMSEAARLELGFM